MHPMQPHLVGTMRMHDHRSDVSRNRNRDKKPKSTKQNKKGEHREHPYSKSASSLTHLHSTTNLDGGISRSISLPSHSDMPSPSEPCIPSKDSNGSNPSNISNGPNGPHGVTSLSVDTIPDAVVQYIDDSHSNTPIHLGSIHDTQWAPLFSDEFWAKPPHVFHQTFSEQFLKQMHQTRGSKELSITQWTVDEDEKTPSNQPTTYSRKLEFISKIKDPPPFMPSQTECYQTERFRFYGSDMVVIDAAISTPNIKYGDYFVILNRIILSVSEEDPNKTRMDVSIAFKWHKKTWFEKIITSKATTEAEEGFALFAAEVHKLFPPKISNSEPLSPQKQSPRKDSNDTNGGSSGPSPRRRVIDQKVLDYFHTERKRKDIILEDWIKPIGEIFGDVIRAMFRWNSWRRLIEKLRRIDDVEEQEDLFTIKHGLMGLIVVVLLLMMGNVCWMMMWFWQSCALNTILRQQNEIIEQRTQILMELMQLLHEGHAVNQRDAV